MLRIRNGWWVVAGSFSALLVGSGAINIFAFGVFVIPVTHDLGISRGAFSTAIFANGITQAVCSPIIGWMIDRYGVRRVVLPGILLTVLATAMYGLMTASVAVIVLLWVFSGIVGMVQTPISYTTVINKWFDARRGLALGLATSGVGLGVVLVPQLSLALLHAFGWRGAYVGLAVAVLILAFVPALLVIRDPEIGPKHRVELSEDLPGYTVAQALASWRFWVLTGVFFLGVVAINGTLTHVVPLLHDRGVPQNEAVRALSAAGLAIILGRMAAGWLLDRIWGPLVAVAFYGLSFIGLALLVSGATGPAAIIGAMLCGAGIGAEIDLMGYLMSRYFGMHAFGKIYGLMFVAFSIGTGFGPGVSGWADQAAGHSYTPIFTIYMGLLVIAAGGLLTLGSYRYRPQPALAPA